MNRAYAIVTKSVYMMKINEMNVNEKLQTTTD